MPAAARVAASAFGDGLFATRELAAGELVLSEQPRFLLAEAAPLQTPGLLAAVSSALGLPAGAEKTQDMSKQLELFLKLDADSRSALLNIFSTPDDTEMATFVRGIVSSVQQQVEPLRARDTDELTRALCCWLLASHCTSCAETGETASALFATASFANHSCDPNLAFQSCGSHGLAYRVRRTLKPGEQSRCAPASRRSLLTRSATRLVPPCGAGAPAGQGGGRAVLLVPARARAAHAAPPAPQAAPGAQVLRVRLRALCRRGRERRRRRALAPVRVRRQPGGGGSGGGG